MGSLAKSPLSAVATPGSKFVSFTPTEQRRINTIVESINDQYRLSIADFAEGKKTEAEWDEFVAHLKSYGSEDLIQIYNNAYARFKQNNN